MLCVAWGSAYVSVLTRKMQAIPYSVVLFYYASFSSIALVIILLFEAAINKEFVRIFTLSWF